MAAASEQDIRTRDDTADTATISANAETEQPRQTSDPYEGLPTRDLKMSRAEAGRKGGLATKQRYGEGHFSRIGHKGGKKGGESTKQRYGVEFYKKIGRKGGSA